MQAFLCLLQNNLLGIDMLFEIEKEKLLYFKQHFDTEDVILQQPREQVLYFYSAKTTKSNWLFSFIEERSNLICDVILIPICGKSCFLLHPCDFRSAARFKKKYVLFFKSKVQVFVLYVKYYLLYEELILLLT